MKAHVLATCSPSGQTIRVHSISMCVVSVFFCVQNALLLVYLLLPLSSPLLLLFCFAAVFFLSSVLSVFPMPYSLFLIVLYFFFFFFFCQRSISHMNMYACVVCVCMYDFLYKRIAQSIHEQENKI